MNSFFKKIFLVCWLLLVIGCPTHGKERIYNIFEWEVIIEQSSGIFSIHKNNFPLIEQSNAQWCLDNDTISMSNCVGHTVQIIDSIGIFGKQKTVLISANINNISVVQSLNFYSDKNFMTTQIELISNRQLSSRYIAPIAVTKPFDLFDNLNNYALFVPYDNDNWVRYKNTPFGKNIPESYEVTALLNSESREGIVMGAIEHDTWKSAIQITSKGQCSIDTLIVYCGAASDLTRDLIPHGAVYGHSIKSPLMFMGRFLDWREGMEVYGDACATISPSIKPFGNRPFGWNSWGKLQKDISYDKAIEVSDYIRDSLQVESFNNDGYVFIGLDAFWDFGFNSEQHYKFVRHCKENHQKAGIYFCPFADWGRDPDAIVEEMPNFKYKDIYLYANGQIIQIDGAYALDPTHPAVKQRILRQVKQFIDWGYEYIKIDFMSHGACESDFHYDKSITTGIQAYNEGLKYINDVIDGKMWINLSIAPLFPSNFAHSRRIGCDAWGDIHNSEYTLNSLSYGWWLDHTYHFNDADHIVLEGVSEGENRARVTSAAITGVYLFGDDISSDCDSVLRYRVKQYLTNNAINQMARECKSFRPIELGINDRAADAFYYSDDNKMYIAVFNFNDDDITKIIPISRLGLDESHIYSGIELWTDSYFHFHNSITLHIPSKDARVIKLDLN